MTTRRPSSVIPPKLPAPDFELVPASQRIIEGSLTMVRGESIAIIVDRSRQELGAALVHAAQSIGAVPYQVVLEELGTRPLAGITPSLEQLLSICQCSVLLVDITEHNELTLRREIIEKVATYRLRHAHLIGLSRQGFLSAFSTDPSRISAHTTALQAKLKPSSILRLRSPAGSNLEITLQPQYKIHSHLGIIRPGLWENLPAGMLMAHTALVNGTYVADASIMGRFIDRSGLFRSCPVSFEIVDGLCRSVSCSDRSLARSIEQQLHSEAYFDRVGMVIVGTNIGLHAPLGELLHDQCLPGVHLTFGFSHPKETRALWSSRGILTVTGSQANVDVDGQALIRGGRYLST